MGAMKFLGIDPGGRRFGVAQGDGEMVDILYMKLQKIVDYIRGEEGSTVRLKVIPADGDAAATVGTTPEALGRCGPQRLGVGR